MGVILHDRGRGMEGSVTRSERLLYHQIHPLKLATDWATGAISSALLCSALLCSALLCSALAAPVLASPLCAGRACSGRLRSPDPLGRSGAPAALRVRPLCREV